VSILVERPEGCEGEAEHSGVQTGVSREQVQIPPELVEKIPQMKTDLEQIQGDPKWLKEGEIFNRELQRIPVDELLRPYTPGDLLRESER
jgi:hypothetical protein